MLRLANPKSGWTRQYIQNIIFHLAAGVLGKIPRKIHQIPAKLLKLVTQLIRINPT